jgi:regulator of sigma E protease
VDVILHSVLPFFAMLVALIMVHELGHFITAKLADVKVLEFGLGFPPRLWGVRKGETEYTVNALPLGGFVRLLGEEDPSDPRSLAAKPRWVRLVVLGAGAAMNVVLAIVLFSLALSIPREVSVGRAQVQGVIPGSPAEQAGLKPGDIVFAVNGRNIQNVAELSYNLRLHLGETVTLKVRRAASEGGTGAQLIDVRVKARWAPDPYTYAAAIAAGQTISASDHPPIDLRLKTMKGFDSGSNELVIDAGTPNEERFKYSLKDSSTITLIERAIGGTEASDHAAGAEVQHKVRQGPTGITIGSAYGQVVPIPEDERRAYEEANPGKPVPKTYTVPFTETQWEPPWKALPLGAQRAYESIILARNQIISWVMGGLGNSATGGGPQVTGPVGIAQATGEVVEEAGWKSLMDFAALLSMNLAVLNILPLPMLDGGRVVFVLIEYARRGKRIAPEKEALVHFVGLVAMLALAVVITYFDVLRIFDGSNIIR